MKERWRRLASSLDCGPEWSWDLISRAHKHKQRKEIMKKGTEKMSKRNISASFYFFSFLLYLSISFSFSLTVPSPALLLTVSLLSRVRMTVLTDEECAGAKTCINLSAYVLVRGTEGEFGLTKDRKSPCGSHQTLHLTISTC